MEIVKLLQTIHSVILNDHNKYWAFNAVEMMKGKTMILCFCNSGAVIQYPDIPTSVLLLQCFDSVGLAAGRASGL